MTYAACRIEYQTIIVDGLAESAAPEFADSDFVTGDIGSPTTYPNNGLAITGAQGTTGTNARVATDTTIDVVSVAGMTIGDHIAIELDTPAAYGTHFWTRIDSISTLTITLSDALPSAVSIGNQVVTAGQLNTTTGFSLFEEFKKPKSREIATKSNELRDGFFLYNNSEFDPTTINLADLASYLAAGKDPTKYSISTVEGQSYTFANADDLYALTDFLAEMNSEIATSQGSLLDSVSLAVNSQAAMDAIVDNRTKPVPTGSGTLQPFVQYDSTSRNQITPSANLTLNVDSGNFTAFADGSVTITADTGATTFNATGGTFAVNAGSETVDINCGVFDLDGNGAISLSTSAGDVTLQPGSGNDVVLDTSGDVVVNSDNIDINASAPAVTERISFINSSASVRGEILYSMSTDGFQFTNNGAGGFTGFLLGGGDFTFTTTDSGNDNFRFTTSGANTAMPFRFDQNGADGGEFRLGSGVLSPAGVVTANGGDIYVEDNGRQSDIKFKREDSTSDAWDSLIGVPGYASVSRSSLSGGDTNSLAATPTLFDSWDTDGPDFGDLVSSSSSNEVAINKVIDDLDGDMFEVSASVVIDLSNNTSITLEVYFDDGSIETATDIRARHVSTGNTDTVTISLCGQFRGPTSIISNGAVFLKWSSPDSGNVTFYESRLNVKRIH